MPLACSKIYSLECIFLEKHPYKCFSFGVVAFPASLERYLKLPLFKRIMTSGRLKSRTFTRKQVRVASRGTITRYVRRKVGKAQCAECGDVLKGMTQRFPGKMQNTPKSKKRPSRPFGGVLCSSCMRKKITDKFRNILSLSSK